MISFAWPEERTGQAQVFTSVDLEFSYLGRRLGLRRLSGAPVARTQGGAPSWRLLQNDFRQSDEPLDLLLQRADVWRLRALVAHGELFVHRLDDRRVRSAISQLLRRGAIGLLERIDVEVPAQYLLPARPAPGAGMFATYSRTPQRATAAGGSPASEASAMAGEARVRHEPIDSLVQDTQAARLVTAARNGTPFCEECARRAAAARAEHVAA